MEKCLLEKFKAEISDLSVPPCTTNYHVPKGYCQIVDRLLERKCQNLSYYNKYSNQKVNI